MSNVWTYDEQAMNLSMIKDKPLKICLSAKNAKCRDDPMGEPMGELMIEPEVNWK